MFINKDYLVYYDEETFHSINWYDNKIKLIKIHGCINHSIKMAITLDNIIKMKLCEGRKNVIDHIFSNGTHKNIVILGYPSGEVHPHLSQAGVLTLQGEDGKSYVACNAISRKIKR